MASTESTGPAGSHFEGQVGATYLLGMLVGAEPRGLPGTTVERIAFQRAAEDYPLDDVIVHAHDPKGRTATLEIQAKRGLTFSPSDPTFRKVVHQMVQASRKKEFQEIRYELAVAISRTSNNIDGAYQTVLTWAKQIGDSTTFMNRIRRPGSANDQMRSFTETFRTHVKETGATYNDEALWLLFRKTHILVFDFTATGSASEELAKERAARALHTEDTARAANLWDELVGISIEIAKSGGDRSREQLKAELGQKGFRLAGDRRNRQSLEALAEASRNALDDIQDRVADVRLTRQQQIASVHAALDRGRYVEIRGEAGVGKSVLLKHFAEQASFEGRIVVLSPGRTIGQGWTAMRSVLNFEGIARELLSELAASGGAFLMIDSLDFFSEDQRRTVCDLVRAASEVLGISVIATARRDFGTGEPDWMPSESLQVLGRVNPVVVEDLSDSEIEELRNSAPQLTALLAESHPARPVVRNLFRLSRLARRHPGAAAFRTEVEMAEEWWQSADGKRDGTHRERSRVLKSLAQQALSRAEPLRVDGLSHSAVDALIESETIRDLGNDRVTFRHDVLREWSIANLLRAEPDYLSRLPLVQPAPADLVRSVELAARLAIERTGDSTAWQTLLLTLSAEGVNGSWRRAVLLALIRSEIAGEVLTKSSARLLTDQGKILVELIRIMMAVDSIPIKEHYAEMGFDAGKIPASINIPTSPTWHRLITWLLKLSVDVPANAIPDVVTLYVNWSILFRGNDDCTPRIVVWLYRWLTEVRQVLDSEVASAFRGKFTGNIGKLGQDLKAGFALFSKFAPSLAAAYLRSLIEDPDANRSRNDVLEFRGTLAEAAPKELTELTEMVLTASSDEDRDHYNSYKDPFGHTSYNFIPASPAQGPFLELLVHAPKHGLPLIRKLIDHAVCFYTEKRDFDEDAIKIVFPNGNEALFPWRRTYNWSRESGGSAVVTSALMALEAWCHRRVEADEPIERVIADVIREPNPPAAYLLVIVDLLLSHWPKSKVVAVPFIASPELLSLDRPRLATDKIEVPDLFGIKALTKEPVGLATRQSLKTRPSRKLVLEQLLPNYIQEQFNEERGTIHALLTQASKRLEQPNQESTFADPELMVIHALNLVDPKNWRTSKIHGADGPEEGLEYVEPPLEMYKNLAAIQKADREPSQHAQMQRNITIALTGASRFPEDFASVAVKWAHEMEVSLSQSEIEQTKVDDSLVGTAAIVARDGGSELIAEHGEWARSVFERTFKRKDIPAHQMIADFVFNPVAVAFAGTAFLTRHRLEIQDVRKLLICAGDNCYAAGQGFKHVAAMLADIDERIPRAILRCALDTCVHPYQARGLFESEDPSLNEYYRRRVTERIDAELSWLLEKGEEPEWPVLEPSPASARCGISRVPGKTFRTDPKAISKTTDVQTAALWLGVAADTLDDKQNAWLRRMTGSYADWTAVANGSMLEDNEQPSDTPADWNRAYFKLIARCLPGQSRTEIDQNTLTLILSLPDQSFFDAMAIFLSEVDFLYFNEKTVDSGEVLYIRSTLAERLLRTRMWQWECQRRSESTEIHLGAAIATLFFNDGGAFSPPQCYLHPPAIERVQPFLPELQKVLENGRLVLVATVLLNLLEVAPNPKHLLLIATAARVWQTANLGSVRFWKDLSIGRRLCQIIDIIRIADPSSVASSPVRAEIDILLNSLIALGLPEAYRLEEALRTTV